MTEYTLTGENPTDLPKRAVRALTEKMSVLPETGRVKNADDLYLVVSESGSEYLVDTRGSRCECPDARHNLDADERCKHERRVQFAIGGTSIPEWVNTDAIDTQLGEHTDTAPLRVATDGGTSTDATTETTSREDCEDALDDSRPVYGSDPDDCACDDLDDNFPCADCYIDGRKELPE